MLSLISTLQDNEEDVSYDVELLFRNIPNRRNNQLYHWINLCS